MRKFTITFRWACLLLAVAAAVLWIRSHYASDSFRWRASRPPPPPALTPASAATSGSASNNVSDWLFLLLKSEDLANAYRPPDRSVKTVPGRLVIQQHPPFEVFL